MSKLRDQPENKKKKDYGFSTSSQFKTKRTINTDGSFNVRQQGKPWAAAGIYHAVIDMSWIKFNLLASASLLSLNLMFSVAFFIAGPEHIRNMELGTPFEQWLNCLFFSFQTFTTVGYGHLNPTGTGVNFIAAADSIVGLVYFAFATALIYARFSRPRAKIRFSDKILITPKKDGKILHFRIVNARQNTLMHTQARVILTRLEKRGENYAQSFTQLELERDKILFFPLNWNIVHIIDDKSPLKDLTPENLSSQNIEILVLIEGFDDYFSQNVYQRFSYLGEDIVWNENFKKMYATNTEGDFELRYKDLNETFPVDAEV